MKITKRGTPASETLWKGTCQSCNSEAEAVESEMTNIREDYRENSAFSWEKCPVCGVHGICRGMLFYKIKKP